MSDDKIYISADDLLRDSFQLGLNVMESGFRPDFIVAVWRGGTPVGIAVQELLDYAGLDTDHIAIRTSYYKGIDETRNQVQVHNLGLSAGEPQPRSFAPLGGRCFRPWPLHRGDLGGASTAAAAQYARADQDCDRLVQT